MPEISGMIQQFLEGNIKTLSAEPVIESKTITENGTYTAPEGVDGYSPVVVNVPAPQPIIESKTITENGTYTVPEGVDGFNPVVVNVPSQEPNIQERVFASNGTFNPPEGVDGYAPVIIDVPMKEEITLNATMNGTYTPSEGRVYNNVIVNVPLPPNAYLLKSVANLPQPIVSFNDGADAPMKSLKVAIEPIQEGSGDPTPTNVRPISGWNEVNVEVAGKNLCNWKVGDTNNALSISLKPNNYVISAESTLPEGNWYIRFTDSSGEYSYSASDVGLNDAWNKTQSGWFYGWFRAQEVHFIVPSDCTLVEIGKLSQNGTINAQLEIGTTATAYEPYNGQTITIDLDGTRYGGTLDVVNGVLTLTHGYIASYNGETLPSTWISDRDVYEEGTTPTIGAEVCYELATPQTIQLTPTAVKSLLGSNNVWADTGDITDAEYFSKETE